MRTSITPPFMLVLAMTMAACGHGSTAPSPSLPPSASAAGVWLGTLGVGSAEGKPLGILWDASETGNTVTGTATFYAGPLSTDQVKFVGAPRGHTQRRPTFADIHGHARNRAGGKLRADRYRNSHAQRRDADRNALRQRRVL